MKVLKNSQIRLETLNHALITSPEGKEWRISHWAVAGNVSVPGTSCMRHRP